MKAKPPKPSPLDTFRAAKKRFKCELPKAETADEIMRVYLTYMKAIRRYKKSVEI